MLNLKRIWIVLLAVLMLFSAAGCAGKAQTLSESRIGIISAMDNEVSMLLSEAEIDHVDTIGGVNFHVGTLHGQPVVIMRSGIGKVMAASAATAMLNNYPISNVIFTGSAEPAGSAAVEEDGQNPVMNFVGNYTCDRAAMLVEADGTENAKFTVTWGSSAWEHSEWTMSGKLDT